MKYVIDLDALKDCMDLLHREIGSNHLARVYLMDVKKLIDRFPKEIYTDETPKEMEKCDG